MCMFLLLIRVHFGLLDTKIAQSMLLVLNYIGINAAGG